ncbi:hypothetical protein [Dongia sp.]|uniref:hypothetical protein n=1 Tax=Dongia sp. TaxID=1977262 RepID=UPI0037507126
MSLLRRLVVLALLLASPAIAADPQPQLLQAGFAEERPWPEAARRGGYDQAALSLTSPGLAFWVDVAHLQQGDHLVLSLKSPDRGIMATRDIPFSRPTDRFFAFAGANHPQRGWQSGPYVGRVQVIRGDQILIEATRQIALP